MKKILNIILLILFILTILVPITGIQVHKMSSTLFLLFSIVHTLVYKNKLGVRKYLLLSIIIISFFSGIFGMIFDEYEIIINIHKVLSIIVVFFLAIHIFIYHKILVKKKD